MRTSRAGSLIFTDLGEASTRAVLLFQCVDRIRYWGREKDLRLVDTSGSVTTLIAHMALEPRAAVE